MRRLRVFSVVAVSILMLAFGNAQAVSIHDIQFTEDASGRSPYVGQEVTISGIVTAVFHDGYVVAEAPGPWKAVFVYSIANGPDVGDEVTLTGAVTEYYGMTEVLDITDYQHLSSGNSVEPILVDVEEAREEKCESVLITIEDVSVSQLKKYGEWEVTNGHQSCLCDDKNDYAYFPQSGDHLESIAGVLFYSFGNFKIEPRTTSDIDTGQSPLHYALRGHVVTMNDMRDIVHDGYLEILGDEIVTIRFIRPYDIPVVDVGGLILPGLIDSHNHPPYNVLDVIPFPELFAERYEWQAHPLCAEFNNQISDILNYGGSNAQRVNIWKLAEARALTAGTTSIQGANCNSSSANGYAHQGIVIHNVERFPARVHAQTFPLRQEQGFWEQKSAEYWDRFIIHLSEGTSSAALDEFNDWQSMGMLDARTTIIHGVPYGPDEWTAMAEAKANLIWSPSSNLRLYGQTTDIPGALGAGVNVALSPDWTPSGTRNILEELREARQYSQQAWDDIITPLQFAEFVTRNAAKAVGIEKYVGQITPGFRANLMVVQGDPDRPYDALLNAEPGDVRLTVVGGRPMYGNPDILAKFGFVEKVETIAVGGEEKGLSIQVESHAIPNADRPFLEVLAELEEAYLASEPKVCDFVGID